MAEKTIDQRLIPTVQYATPTAGQTVTVNSGGHVRLIVNPAGTLATLTIALPSDAQDGDLVELSTSQIVTALTISGGTIIGTITTLAVAGFGRFIYSGTASKWFRLG